MASRFVAVNARTRIEWPRAGAVFFKSVGASPHVHDDNFFMAVVIQVTERQTARSVRIGDSGSRLRGEIIKLPIAAVPVEQSLLPERLTGASGVDLRVYMAIGEDQVLPSIVIGIDCRCAQPK
jgi:hypothetical protein